MNIIRTSDRGQFKSCRRAWDIGSKIRQSMEPKRLPHYLGFGTAIHKALEVYYAPDMWNWDREVVHGLALTAFVETHKQQRLDYLEAAGVDQLPDDMQLEYDANLILGKGMLPNYFAWAPTEDKFTPKFIEIEFEVSIPCPEAWRSKLPPAFDIFDGNLYLDNEPVVYQGRIDLLVEDEHGEYWIMDHKTASQMREDVLTFLELDEQVGSYCWAIQEMLGIKVAGAIYNELYKGIPEPPKQNAAQRMGRWYSVNRQQDTSYEVYLETVKTMDALAHSKGLYDDFLTYLKAQGNKYFRRTQIHRSQTELQNLGRQICMEAIDMLNDPFIYPNPTRFRCGNCWYRLPCLALNDGSDTEWIMKEQFKAR